LTWNRKATTQKSLTLSFCKIAKFVLNHPDVKQLLYNVQDAKIMAIQKLTVPNHSIASNAADRIAHNPVRNPEMPQLNASFATETILLIIKAALFAAISSTHATKKTQQELPTHPNKPQATYANI
jgi:hypothetical protein